MIDEPNDAMMLAADREWRKCFGSFYCNAHSGRAEAIRAIWKAMLAEAKKSEPKTAESQAVKAPSHDPCHTQ